VDVTTEDETATILAGSTLCKSPCFNVMHVNDLCNEELIYELLDIFNIVELGYDILFIDFVNVDTPNVLDTERTRSRFC
jgi:hypothetical protein